ncbi:nucleoside phosphorylase [Chitinophaga agri]|uniref:Uridine phosphorylase n=1 Tax=Chitinophaga agri TaxID=2703787 RepID=A0A6B9ZAG1_9BACT|nr:nucleoside phosphorylase [Chitinophaga agri]QHS58294.1 nucleoside phosphorylase [Chitinophaga agri]
MDKRIAESELILNSRGAVYHLDLQPEELAGTIVTVGDPDRVQEVSKHFDKVEVKRQHREFVSHTGYIGQKRLTVVSTGIGTDNIDIVLNELDALVNIDFATRTVKQDLTRLKIVRLGTSGALQGNVPVDSFVVSSHGLGLDNLLPWYEFDNTTDEEALLEAFHEQVQLRPGSASPYLISAAPGLAAKFTDGYISGITVTCPGFYAPQGRALRGPLSHPQLLEQLTAFKLGRFYISNFEMETAGIYGLGRVLGHDCLSISTIVANRIGQQFTKDGAAAVERMIVKSLEIIGNE